MSSQVPEVDDLLALEAELAELGDAPMDAFEDAQEAPKASEEAAAAEAEAAAELSKASSETKLATIAEQAEEEEEVQGDQMDTDQEEPKPTEPAPAAEAEEDAAATESAPAEDDASAAADDSAATAASTAPAPKKKPAFAAKKKPLVVAKAAPAAEKEAGEADAADAPAAAEPSKKKAAAAAAPAKPKPAVVKKGLAVAKAPAKPAAAKAAVPKAVVPKAAVPKAKAKAAQPDAETPAGATAAAIKRAKTAYFFFCEERRAQIKETDPELTFGEVGAKLGAEWKELSEADKAPFNARAEADKQRYKEEVEAAGPEAAAAAAAAKKAKKEKPKAVTAYQLYCEDMRSVLQAENPNAGAKEVEKLLAAGWKEATPEDKTGYESAAKEAKAEKRSAAAAAAPSKKRGKKGTKASAADEAEDVAGEEASAAMDEDDDDEQERMACDWVAHPAVAIISETKAGKYRVLREGLGFEQYGLVDAKAAKMQRLGQSSTSEPLPVSLAMVEEYEASVKAFKRAVHDRQDCGELDLEDLPAGNPLETCFFLGKLREPGNELHRKDNGDIDMKVPMLVACRIFQRMLGLERQAKEQAVQRAVLAEGRVAELEGGKAGAGGAAMEA